MKPTSDDLARDLAAANAEVERLNTEVVVRVDRIMEQHQELIRRASQIEQDWKDRAIAAETEVERLNTLLASSPSKILQECQKLKESAHRQVCEWQDRALAAEAEVARLKAVVKELRATLSRRSYEVDPDQL